MRGGAGATDANQPNRQTIMPTGAKTGVPKATALCGAPFRLIAAELIESWSKAF
jgi:hypothetical protein